MDFKNYKTTIQQNLPPSLEAGTILKQIKRIEANTFKMNNQDVKGMRVFAIDVSGQEKEYRTSSAVVIEQLTDFFKAHPNETLDNVKIVSPRGKNYLTLEEA